MLEHITSVIDALSSLRGQPRARPAAGGSGSRPPWEGGGGGGGGGLGDASQRPGSPAPAARTAAELRGWGGRGRGEGPGPSSGGRGLPRRFPAPAAPGGSSGFTGAGEPWLSRPAGLSVSGPPPAMAPQDDPGRPRRAHPARTDVFHDVADVDVRPRRRRPPVTHQSRAAARPRTLRRRPRGAQRQLRAHQRADVVTAGALVAVRPARRAPRHAAAPRISGRCMARWADGVIALRPDRPGERAPRVLARREPVEHPRKSWRGCQPSSARARSLT